MHAHPGNTNNCIAATSRIIAGAQRPASTHACPCPSLTPPALNREERQYKYRCTLPASTSQEPNDSWPALPAEPPPAP
jgi:hypothetical protein